MTSLIRLLAGFEYYLSARKTVNKWLYERMESLHSYITVTQQTQIKVRDLSHFAQPVKWLWQQESIYYYFMCIVDYVMIRMSKRLSDNIHKTERVVSVKISSNNPSFTSNHFKFHFLWKTYSLVFDDFCNLSATRVFVLTNGQCKMYKNC